MDPKKKMKLNGLESAMSALKPVHSRRRSKPAGRAVHKKSTSVVDLECTEVHQDFLVVVKAGLCLVLDAANKSGVTTSDLYGKVPYHKLAADYFRQNCDATPFSVMRFYKKARRWALSPQTFPLKQGESNNSKTKVLELRRAPTALYVFRGVARAASKAGITETANTRLAQYKNLPLGLFHSLYKLENKMVAEYATMRGNPPAELVTPQVIEKAEELAPKAEEPAPKAESTAQLHSIRVQLAEYTDDGQYIQNWQEEWDIEAPSHAAACASARQRIENRDPDWVPVKKGSDYQQVIGTILTDAVASV